MGVPWKADARREALQDAAITPAEVAAKRESLLIGQHIQVPVLQYNDEGTQIGVQMEWCAIEYKSVHVVVLRRKNGMMAHTTYVELVMQDRREQRGEKTEV